MHLKINFIWGKKNIVRISGVKAQLLFSGADVWFPSTRKRQNFFFFKHFWGRIIPRDGEAWHDCCDLQAQFQITWCRFKSNEVEFNVQALHRDETFSCGRELALASYQLAFLLRANFTQKGKRNKLRGVHVYLLMLRTGRILWLKSWVNVRYFG